MNVRAFWDAVLRQGADAIREYFHPDAWVNWHNTNEHFTVEEFIRANCEYPGEWDGEVERIITTDTHTITATHVYSNWFMIILKQILGQFTFVLCALACKEIGHVRLLK